MSVGAAIRALMMGIIIISRHRRFIINRMRHNKAVAEHRAIVIARIDYNVVSLFRTSSKSRPSQVKEMSRNLETLDNSNFL